MLKLHTHAIALVYAVVMTLLQPALVLKLWWRGRLEPQYRRDIAQRFAFGDSEPPSSEFIGKCIWVHAVSLGETRALAPWLHQWREENPKVPVLLTHSTASGWAAGEELLQAGDLQQWSPWDSPAAVRRFFLRWRPRLAVFMETEVWPGWMREARRQQVPTVLLNARMSERSAERSRRAAALMMPAYASFDLVLAQSEEDANRFKRLGCTAINVMGNLKYDMLINQDQCSQGRAWKKQFQKPTIVLASFREGEEAIWADALERLTTPLDVHWLIVPRHPQRWDDVAAMLAARGWLVSRRSQWGLAGPTIAGNVPTVWLGDSLGEMAMYFGMADVALLGGSFAPFGGQNLIESLACGCPVITGPHTRNFASVVSALSGDAVVSVHDMSQALLLAHSWVMDQVGLKDRARLGQDLISKHTGAARKSVRASALLLT